MLKSDTKWLTFLYTLRFSISHKISLYNFFHSDNVSLYFVKRMQIIIIDTNDTNNPYDAK